MTRARIHIVILFFLLLWTRAAGQNFYSGKVIDAVTGEAVPGAAVTQGNNWALTDSLGVFRLKTLEKSPVTITSLHNRGFESYAIVIPPYDETAETIMTNHHWEGSYFFHFSEWNFDYDLADEDVWVIPGEWVLDAVNCCTEDSFYRNPWPAAFDAGWTHAGDYDRDPARFGKSVRRKTDAAGKLVDTNNSTNDFVPNSAPSLKK